MKLETMEGRAGSLAVLPETQDRHLDVLCTNEKGDVLVGTSGRNTRLWHGSIWYYQDAEHLQDPQKCLSSVKIENGVNDLCWVNDKVFIAGLDSGSVASWETNTDQECFSPLWEAREHDDLVSSVTVYRRDCRAVSGGYDGRVKVWEIEDDVGNSSFTYKAHSDMILCVDHQQQAPVFVSTSRDGNIIVWDTRKSKPAVKYSQFNKHGPVFSLWKPGSENIAMADSNGYLFLGDLRMDNEWTQIQAHDRRITAMTFSTEGGFLATGAEDTVVKVFDISSGQFEPVLRADEHKDYVRSLAFRSETELLSCAYDGKILRHNLNNQSMELNGDLRDNSR